MATLFTLPLESYSVLALKSPGTETDCTSRVFGVVLGGYLSAHGRGGCDEPLAQVIFHRGCFGIDRGAVGDDIGQAVIIEIAILKCCQNTLPCI